jgi:hypothetical protein
MQIGRFQNLFTLQTAVSLEFNGLQLKIRILKQQASCRFAHACVGSANQRSE